MKSKIKTGDNVIVIAGKDKGKEGVVKSVFPQEGKLIVEGINMVKKHQKPSASNPQGSIKDMEAKMYISKVAIKDPKTGEPSRIGFIEQDGKKVRISKKSKEVL